jgi:hypothetical protein
MKGYCYNCGLKLSEDNSSPSSIKAKSGLCRVCDSEYRSVRYQRNKKKIAKTNKNWRDRNKKYSREQRLQYEKDNPEKKQRHLKQTADGIRFKLTGVTSKQFYKKLFLQKNLCEICKEPMASSIWIRRPCQDHDHKTGQIRDILCSQCNLCLGNARDNKEILASAIQYLQKWADNNLKTVVCSE